MRFEQEMRLRLLIAHDEHMKRPTREIFPKRAEKGPPVLCAHCKQPIPVYPMTRPKRFCTTQCRKQHRAKRYA